jgi:hypothetical protein
VITPIKTKVLLAGAAALLVSAPSWALSTYSQNFEGLTQSDPAALSNDGWLVFANVFSPDMSTYYYGYGPFGAPNPGGGFSAIASGQGGPGQGNQQLSVYSDYNNTDHALGNRIDANVFQQQAIVAGDVGQTFTFTFDAKLGNLAGATTALAFIKTLNPSAGYATTNFVTANMTSIPSAWGTYSLSLSIDPGLVGQLLQFGFENNASNYQSSGVFYDNINFAAVPVPGAAWLFGSAIAVLGGLRRRLNG